MQRGRQSRHPECDYDFPGFPDQSGKSSESMRCDVEPRNRQRDGISSESATVPGAQFSAISFPEPELPQPIYVHAAWFPALRLSAIKEFRLCLFPTGEPERGTRSRTWTRTEPRL